MSLGAGEETSRNGREHRDGPFENKEHAPTELPWALQKEKSVYETCNTVRH